MADPLLSVVSELCLPDFPGDLDVTVCAGKGVDRCDQSNQTQCERSIRRRCRPVRSCNGSSFRSVISELAQHSAAVASSIALTRFLDRNTTRDGNQCLRLYIP